MCADGSVHEKSDKVLRSVGRDRGRAWNARLPALGGEGIRLVGMRSGVVAFAGKGVAPSSLVNDCM